MKKTLLTFFAAASLSGVLAQAPDQVLFDDSQNDLFYDQSFILSEAPSVYVPYVHPEWGDKFAVSTTYKHTGNNSLQLGWTSNEGGNWAAMAAKIGWLPLDMDKAISVTMWLYSPIQLAGSALPAVYFEAQAGGTTGKLDLGNYLESLPAATWTQITIPVTDFKSASPDFNAFSTLKGIFFTQSVSDGIAHTLYTDDIIFVGDPSWQEPTEVPFFSDAPVVDFYDWCWLNATSPAVIERAEANEEKLPVSTTIFHSGTNSLKYSWQNNDGGITEALIAAVNWESADVTSMNYLEFYVYSPESIPADYLPSLMLERANGNPNKTELLSLADYLPSGIPATTWTLVSIPLDDYKAITVTDFTWSNIKGLFFYNLNPDLAVRTMYIDDISFTKEQSSGVEEIKKTNLGLNIYFDNGSFVAGFELQNTSDVSVSIMDISGRTVATPVTDKKFLAGENSISGSLNLEKGIYIFKIVAGNQFQAKPFIVK